MQTEGGGEGGGGVERGGGSSSSGPDFIWTHGGRNKKLKQKLRVFYLCVPKHNKQDLKRKKKRKRGILKGGTSM